MSTTPITQHTLSDYTADQFEEAVEEVQNRDGEVTSLTVKNFLRARGNYATQERVSDDLAAFFDGISTASRLHNGTYYVYDFSVHFDTEPDTLDDDMDQVADDFGTIGDDFHAIGQDFSAIGDDFVDVYDSSKEVAKSGFSRLRATVARLSDKAADFLDDLV